jgi:hypothetical protein
MEFLLIFSLGLDSSSAMIRHRCFTSSSAHSMGDWIVTIRRFTTC